MCDEPIGYAGYTYNTLCSLILEIVLFDQHSCICTACYFEFINSSLQPHLAWYRQSDKMHRLYPWIFFVNKTNGAFVSYQISVDQPFFGYTVISSR